MKESVDPIDRPAWDTARVIPPQCLGRDLRLKANHMNDQQLTLKERLVRYNAKTITDEVTPYCRSSRMTSTCCDQAVTPRMCRKAARITIMGSWPPLTLSMASSLGQKDYVKLRAR